MKATEIPNNKLIIHKRILRMMGNRFEISVVENRDNVDLATKHIEVAIAEISRIEKLLSSFSGDNLTNEINLNAGIQPVKVDMEVFNLIARSLKISELTQGAFDITYQSIDKSLWNFDVNTKQLPDTETARRSVRLINYRNVILDEANRTVFLKENGMRIGFGRIGKGYAIDRAKHILQARGIRNGIINTGGDMITWGNQRNGKPWTIAVADPNHTVTPFSTMKISNMAIATSGNYKRYALINGKDYTHAIDPKTGLPVSGVKSVSIISPSAELAHAMATPLMIMGVKVGLEFVNQLAHIACIIVDDHNQIHRSDNLNIKL